MEGTYLHVWEVGLKLFKRMEQPENMITVSSIRFLYKGISGLAVTVVCFSSLFRVVCRNLPLSKNCCENVTNGNC
jgi:hypothetical protein